MVLLENIHLNVLIILNFTTFTKQQLYFDQHYYIQIQTMRFV